MTAELHSKPRTEAPRFLNFHGLPSSMYSDVDVDSVHQTINVHEVAIEALDAEIEGLRRTIRQLEYQTQTHKAEIRRCRGMITLARRLPPEILASIFEECVHDGWTRTPLSASHVCSSWREAASIPSVWSHVYVNFDARDPYKRTQLWLDKSKGSLLTIDLEIGSDVSHLDKMTELLQSSLPRWKVLNVKSAMLQPVNKIVQLCDQPTPHLQSVDITVAQEFFLGANELNSDEHDLVAFRSSFLKAPHFRSLNIRRNILPRTDILPTSISNLSFQLPSYQSITTQSLSSIVDLLEGLPNLQVFAIEVPNGQTQQFVQNVEMHRVVTLPCLTTLSLIGKDDLFAILPHLRVSSLTHLFLRSSLDYSPTPEAAEWIEQFLRDSFARITFLEIRDLGLNPEVYGRVLPLLPSVEELRLHDCDILDSTIQELNGPQGLCPRLKKLDFRWCGRLNGWSVVNLVRSRLPLTDLPLMLVSITEITLINCSNVKEQDIMDLAEMTVCSVVHRGQADFCSKFGCCENDRYRRRLKQRHPLHPSIQGPQAYRRLIL